MLILLFAMCFATEPTVSWDTLAQVQTLQASFTQTQHRAWLREPLISTGTIAFTRPATIEWVVIEPSASVMSWQDGQLSMQSPGQPAMQINLAETPQATPLVDAFTVWLSGDVAAIQRAFTIDYVANGAVLTPKDEAMHQHLASMTLTVAASGQYVERVVLTEPDSDTLTIELSDVTVRTALVKKKTHHY